VAPWTQLPAPPNGAPSPVPCTSQPGVTVAGAGHLAVNCVAVARDPVAADFEAGLFDADGRLLRTDTCPGNNNTGGSGGSYYGFDGNSLFQDAFISADSTATPTALRTYLTGPPGTVPLALQGVLSSAVLRCPRLLLLPVLAVPGGATGIPTIPSEGGDYPVVTMKYLWLGSDKADNGFFFNEGELTAVQGWLLDPALFSSQVSKSVGLDPYAGPGLPRQVRLVHDRDDAQPAMTPPLGPP
jgi:hypothetical protein